MSGVMEWRKCPHCKKDRYCTEAAMVQHIEDCPERPSMKAKKKLCPKCGSLVGEASNGLWVCVNESCDFTITVMLGGKIS